MTNPRKAHITKKKVNIKYNVKCWIIPSLRLGTCKDVCSNISFQHCIVSLYKCNKARKRNKRHLEWKGRCKMISICRWNNCLYRNRKEFTKQLIELRWLYTFQKNNHIFTYYYKQLKNKNYKMIYNSCKIINCKTCQISALKVAKYC